MAETTDAPEDLIFSSAAAKVSKSTAILFPPCYRYLFVSLILLSILSFFRPLRPPLLSSTVPVQWLVGILSAEQLNDRSVNLTANSIWCQECIA
jgi:hypothetical protein